MSFGFTIRNMSVNIICSKTILLNLLHQNDKKFPSGKFIHLLCFNLLNSYLVNTSLKRNLKKKAPNTLSIKEKNEVDLNWSIAYLSQLY